MKLFRRSPNVEFCDRCGRTCDDRCRSDAAREAALAVAFRRDLRI